jgi:hypothetical protein
MNIARITPILPLATLVVSPGDAFSVTESVSPRARRGVFAVIVSDMVH